LQGAAEDIDIIIHAAGHAHTATTRTAGIHRKITLEGTRHLLAEAEKHGVQRFIFSSSCSNYGAGGEDMLTEESTFNPVTPYGESKVMVERDVSRMANDRFSPVFLRNATAFGVSRRLRFDLVVNNLVAWAVTTGKVHLKSDGSAWRPLVHIRDISAAFLATLEAPADAVQNKAFNVGVPGENFRIKQVAEMVKETVPGSELRFEQGASADTRNYQVDCSRLPATVPAFKTSWTVKAGIEECYDSFTKSGVTLEEFEGIRYKRIDHVRRLIADGILDDKLRHKAR